MRIPITTLPQSPAEFPAQANNRLRQLDVDFRISDNDTRELSLLQLVCVMLKIIHMQEERISAMEERNG